MNAPFTPDGMADAFTAWMRKEGLLDKLTEREVERLSKAFMAGMIHGIRYAP